MEKLREHERDMMCPKDSMKPIISTPKSMRSTNKSAKQNSNQFSKSDENSLASIRY